MTPHRPTRAYPWLLLLSTSVACLFCFMYISKPEFYLSKAVATPTLTRAAKPTLPLQPTATVVPAPPVAGGLLPGAASLPGDTDTPPSGPRPTQGGKPPTASFEETNLHIQHVLTATTPGGDLSRIVLNVPVLYQSRSLAWTDAEVAESRELLKRLSTYQENSRLLREEAGQILAGWNHLLERSIPSSVLRADSPSLPINQDQAAGRSQGLGLDTTESIQIQFTDK
ncbi:MAG: hypothetical protein WCJ66_01055 [Verrucomicrobiota bacterium]